MWGAQGVTPAPSEQQGKNQEKKKHHWGAAERPAGRQSREQLFSGTAGKVCQKKQLGKYRPGTNGSTQISR